MQENWGSEGKRRRLTALFLSFRKPITFYALTAAVAAGFRRNHTRVQHDRINDLYDRSRLVAVRPQLHIAAVLDILRGKDARAAFAAEQYNAFVKYRQSVHDTRTTDYAADFTFNAIEKADINAVETSIKLNPLNINRNTEQFRFTRLHRCNAAGINQLLRIAGEIHANVTQALLAAAGVVNLFGVDADRFAEAACTVAVIAADRTRAANFFSHVYYLQTKIEATSVSIYSEIFRGVTLRSPSVPAIQGDFRQRGRGLLYTSIQTPPALWLRTQASTKRTPSTPSSTVGKVSVVFSRPALRSESTLQNER